MRKEFTLPGFAGAVVAAAIFVVGIYWMSFLQARAQQWIVHTHEVLAAIATTRADLVDIQNSQRGFVITGREDDLKPYDAARRALDGDVRHLRELTTDNASQRRRVDALEAAVAARLAHSAAEIDARRNGGFDAARTLARSGAPVREVEHVRGILQEMAIEESHLLSTRLEENERRLYVFWACAALLLVGALATLSVLYAQERRRREVERRLLESERAFHLMTDSVSDYAIVMLDEHGRVQTWNAGARRIKGYAAEEIVGSHIEVFYPPEDRESGKPYRALAIAASEGRYVEEGWRVRKDASRFWASVVIEPLKDPQRRVTGFSKITRDMTEARAAQEAQRARELSAKLIAAQEEERRHVARELHDETGQDLTLIRAHLAELARGKAPASRVGECIELVDRAIAHVRGLSLKLRPPMLDDLGLPDALSWALEQQARAAGWQHGIDIPQADTRLPKDVETTCFRIAQEALTNASRYSGASQVRISLRLSEGRVELEVRDNGQGFDPARYSSAEERAKHFGLVSMRERAAIAGGHLDIDAAPGRGTCVHATIPISPVSPGW